MTKATIRLQRRRYHVLALALLAGGLAIPASVSARRTGSGASHHAAPVCPGARWVESWEAPPSDADSAIDPRLVSFAHGPEQTLRMIITPHYGGSLLRVRLSNRFGNSPVTFSQVAIAKRRSGASLIPGTSTPVRFAGASSVTVPAGADAVSDPVRFHFRAFETLAVSIYLASQSGLPTEHFTARQTSYGTAPLVGNHVADPGAGAFTQSTTARYYVTGLDVRASGDTGTVVAFGDSITDGYQGPASVVPEDEATDNLNARYPDWLARRVLAAHLPLSIVNAGISGNRILQSGQIPMFGPSGISRFRADALRDPGVTTVIILEGANDIGQSKATAPEVITGLMELVHMARAAGVRVLLGTLTPMGSAAGAESSYGGAKPNAVRVAINSWIRRQHIANGYVDFARAVADPSNPSVIAPAYNGGDGLHFSPAGYRALARAVPLGELRGPACRSR